MGKRWSHVWRAVLVGVLLLFASHAAAAEPVLSYEAFERRVAADITRTYPGARVKPREDRAIAVQLPNGEEFSYSLARAYALYEGTPSELPTIVGNLVSSLGEKPPAALNNLVVLVRPTRQPPGQKVEASQRVLQRPLAGNLSAYVAEDRPDSYAIAKAEVLAAQLRIDEASIWEAALENTRRKLDFQQAPLRIGRIAELRTEDGLAPSVLALDEFWESPELASGGPVVVAVFARSVVYLALERDRDAVSRLRELMEESEGDPNSLTGQLFVRRNGRWEVLP